MPAIDSDMTRVSPTPPPRAEEQPRRQEEAPPPEPEETQPSQGDPALGNSVDVYA